MVRGIIQVGQKVHLSRRERRDLEELASRMERAARLTRPGWLKEFVEAWNRAGKIIARGIERAHQDPQHVSELTPPIRGLPPLHCPVCGGSHDRGECPG